MSPYCEGDGSFWHRVYFVGSVFFICLGLATLHTCCIRTMYLPPTEVLVDIVLAESKRLKAMLVEALEVKNDRGKIKWTPRSGQ